MDISSLSGKSVLENVDCSLGLQCSADRKQRPCSSIFQDSVSNLESAFGESLSINEVRVVGEEFFDAELDGDVEQHGSSRDGISGVEKWNECTSHKGQEENCKPKCLNNCVTFPGTKTVLPPNGPSDGDEEEPEVALRWLFGEEHYNQGYSHSVSLPSPVKLVSAMKGSREKEGLSTEKLTVKWAADVYDPPVTLMSHTVKGNKQQKSRNKKNWKRDGKKGQKSSTSRGKDKKQYRKGGASERGHKSVDPRDMISDTNDEYGGLVGGRESHSYCGSSFLKNSLTSMHYPVAEAL